MGLDDIFEDSDPIQEAIDELLFQEHLKKLSELPDWKKKEVEKELKFQETGVLDLGEIKKYRCVHCEDTFDSEEDLAEEERYCPYCRVVCFGREDKRWIKKVGKREPKRGFNGKRI